MTYSQVDKANDIPTWNTSASRQQIRGFFVLNPDASYGGQSGSLAAGAPAYQPVDGDTLQLQVRVHNYSLHTAARGVPGWSSGPLPGRRPTRTTVGRPPGWAPSPWA